MKKTTIYIALLALCAAIFLIGAGSFERDTWTTSFTYLGGDSTETAVVDTSEYYINRSYEDCRAGKVFYQADMSVGGMSSCSIWVDLYNGTGPWRTGYWKSLGTFVITDDSLYSTTGYDLLVTIPYDSLLPYFKIRTRAQTQDSDSGAYDGEKVDSVYSISHSVEVLAR